MFGYFGSKAKLVNQYPSPDYDVIVEPFAGTAQYALKYWDRDVILIDRYSVVIDILKWLQGCSKDDVLSTRRLRFGEHIDDFVWDCKEQRDMVGFIIAAGVTTPRKTPSKWKTVFRPNTQNFRLQCIAENLDKIRHWDIRLGDYQDSPDIEATWFIDPPYQKAGKEYKHGSSELDYHSLGDWVRQRRGQVIACESHDADWLPFKTLSTIYGSRKKSTEAVFLRTDKTLLKPVQQNLF